VQSLTRGRTVGWPRGASGTKRQLYIFSTPFFSLFLSRIFNAINYHHHHNVCVFFHLQ
jgi:hypothetical protein